MVGRVLGAGLVGAAVLLATPASAAVEASDPCGDTTPVLGVGEQSVPAPGGRDPGFDLRRLQVSDLLDGDRAVGTAVVLDLCGDLPAPELPGSTWSVSWTLPGGCVGQVSVYDVVDPRADGQPRRAQVGKTCSTAEQTPAGTLEDRVVVYDVELPAAAWRVAGSRIVWELRRDAVPAQAAAELAPGTVWEDVQARAADGRRSGDGFVGTVRFAGPGTSDALRSGADHVVG